MLVQATASRKMRAPGGLTLRYWKARSTISSPCFIPSSVRERLTCSAQQPLYHTPVSDAKTQPPLDTRVGAKESVQDAGSGLEEKKWVSPCCPITKDDPRNVLGDLVRVHTVLGGDPV